MAENETDQRIADLLGNIDQMDSATLARAKILVSRINEEQRRQAAKDSFIKFVQHVYPSFIPGWHISEMAKTFDEMVHGNLRRVAISMPPRHSKSMMSTMYLPAYWLGMFPDSQVMCISATNDLATSFGRATKDIIDTDAYREIFPDIRIRSDAKAAGAFQTTMGGRYWALSVGSSLVGRGSSLCVIDDPVSEQLGAQIDPKAYDDLWDFFGLIRQRAMPSMRMAIVQTRWNPGDLIGRVIEQSEKNLDLEPWKILNFPAILPATGRQLWPEFWSLKEMEQIRAELPPRYWQAQYMGSPTLGDEAIVPKGWWQTWKGSTTHPENVLYRLQSWDTAFSAKESSDFSVCTTMDVIEYKDERNIMQTGIYIRDIFEERMDFPDLKKRAREKYRNYRPDKIVIEEKSTGGPLLQELRISGLPVEGFLPARGNDKVLRLNAITDLISSGNVFLPRHAEWIDDMTTQFADFPYGRNDDIVDSVVQGLLKLRQSGLTSMSSDDYDDEDDHFQPVKADYY